MEKSAFWVPVAALGSLVGGVAAVLALVWPKPDAADLPEKAQPAALENAPSLMRQASIGAAEDAQLQQLVGSYLDNVQSQFGNGMTPAPGFVDGMASLQAGADSRWQIHLAGGSAYRVIGACDNECSNVDIELIDIGGAVVASDMLPDDFPVIDYTPATSGAYYLRVVMQNCTLAPCYAGARVLTGAAAAGN